MRAGLRSEPWPGDPTQQSLDWDAFARLATVHGVEWLVQRALAAPRGGAPPSHVHERIAQLVRKRARESLALTRELVHATAVLEAAGVATLSFKGPTLALVLYRDLAARPSADVDILVRPGDAPRAMRVLRAAGYRVARPPFDLEGIYTVRLTNHIPITRDGRGVVELHWALTSPWTAYDFDLDGLFRRASTVELGGERIRTMSLENLAWFLCFHGCKHHWARLEWLCDVAALLNRPDVDWGGAIASARHSRVLRPLLVGVLLAQAALKAPMPAACVAPAAADPSATRIVERITKRMPRYWARGAQGPPRLPINWLSLAVRASAGERIRLVARSIFRPAIGDIRWLPLPRALFPLYYFVRPLRLALRYGLGRGRSARSNAPA